MVWTYFGAGDPAGVLAAHLLADVHADCTGALRRSGHHVRRDDGEAGAVASAVGALAARRGGTVAGGWLGAAASG